MKLYKVWTLFDAACKSKLAIGMCCLLLASAFVVGCGSDDETDELNGSQDAALMQARCSMISPTLLC